MSWGQIGEAAARGVKGAVPYVPAEVWLLVGQLCMLRVAHCSRRLGLLCAPVPQICRRLAHHFPAVAACISNGLCKPAAVGRLCKGAMLSLAGCCALAATASSARKIDHAYTMLVIVPPLFVLIGMRMPNWMFSHLAWFLLPAPIFRAVKTRGVLAGAVRWHGAYLGCLVHGSLHMLYLQPFGWPRRPGNATVDV